MQAMTNIQELTKLSFDYEALEDFSSQDEAEVIVIAKCPSISDAFTKFPLIVQEFFIKNASLGINVEINEEIDPLSDQQLFQLAEIFKNIKKSFLIAFESSVDHSSCIYWRYVKDNHFFSLKVDGNEAKVGEFVADILMKTLRFGYDGKITQLVP